MDDWRPVRRHLVALRKAADLGQVDVAERAGIGTATVSRVENTEQDPSYAPGLPTIAAWLRAVSPPDRPITLSAFFAQIEALRIPEPNARLSASNISPGGLAHGDPVPVAPDTAALDALITFVDDLALALAAAVVRAKTARTGTDPGDEESPGDAIPR